MLDKSAVTVAELQTILKTSGVARMKELPGHMQLCTVEAAKQQRIRAKYGHFLAYILFSYQEGLS